MKINVDFNSLAELLNFSKTLANGLVPVEQESKADKNLPIGASNWKQAYEHTMGNLRRAYERIREFEDLKKTNPVIRDECEKINSELRTKADQEQSELQKDLLTNLTFSARVLNALHNWNIITISQLLQCTESDLMRIHNFGKTSLKDVKDTLKANKLKLKGKEWK